MRPRLAVPCRTSWWRTKPLPRQASPCCGARTRAAPPSCRWIQSSPVCSGENCPARQGWQAVWSRPMHGTVTSCPICWAASSWWMISTRPPVWPGTTVSAARSSRWMVRWSMRAAALPAAVSSAARVCSPASRSWRSCGSRLRNCRRSALPLRKRPTSANSRQMP